MDDDRTPRPAAEPGRPGDPDTTDRPDGPAGVMPVDLRDWVDFSPDAATRVRVFQTARLALDVWCLEPRQSTPVLHEPDRDVTYTVVGGRSWFVTDDGEVGLDPLGALLVPAGTVHGIDNRAPDPLIIVAHASPPGDEEPGTPVAATGEAIRWRDDGPGPLRRTLHRLLGD